MHASLGLGLISFHSAWQNQPNPEIAALQGYSLFVPSLNRWEDSDFKNMKSQFPEDRFAPTAIQNLALSGDVSTKVPPGGSFLGATSKLFQCIDGREAAVL
eukprot:GHVN01003037.1.p1 GENE.GHVN01003037.1~~GHVN01003037.1.p1  ORF type:complete len:101 (-),score=8.51 GHVN01003037.1:178-480(-)